ncbi:hypothetical protein QAD02_002391 [Eretmocerus hayati]|uniref:Uncharacterized protein n=1 Tax=Eretmocerus hayati TaxID=131215 RepID=A0ACC2NJ74_9HYME|nr:hypothetical protein QAD02_002391 [Eretmocerus hayati]
MNHTLDAADTIVSNFSDDYDAPADIKSPLSRVPQRKRPRIKEIQQFQKGRLAKVSQFEKEQVKSKETVSRPSAPKTQASECTSTERNVRLDPLVSTALNTSSSSIGDPELPTSNSGS